ncbi:MAG: tetratricopeptide repeat protein [Alphaproteobacteria bacterium]|nr:tetratricopeptide repeat protein [Alphaproteobacteria bacterium]
MDNEAQDKAPISAMQIHDAVAAGLARGAVAEASAELETALARWPGHSKLRLLKGEVLARTARTDAALYYADLLDDQALAVWASPRLVELLGGAPLELDGALAVARRVSRAEAEDKLREPVLEALLKRPDQKEAARLLKLVGARSGIFRFESKLAVQRTEAGKFEAAIELLEKARAEGRLVLHAAMLLSDLLSLCGRLDDAIVLLEEWLERHPEHADVYRRLTMMLQRARKFDRAADVFEMAVGRWPQDWMLVYRLNRLPVAPQRYDALFGAIRRGAEGAWARNDRLRFQLALAALHSRDAAEGFEMLKKPFEHPVSILALPVKKALGARAPKDWLAGSRLKDDRTLEVQVARSADARATVLLTTGIAFGNLPLAFLDTLFAAHRMNVVYLRDFGKRAYLRGISSLGDDEADTVAALKRMVAELGAKRTIAMGSSSGGFSALRTGALVGADVAVSFSGPTAMTEFFDDTRVSAWNPNFFVKAQIEQEGELPFDLVPVLSKPWPTRFIQFYGQGAREDAAQARRLEGLPGVTLTAVPGVEDHFVVDHMIGDGSFELLLEQLGV